MFVRHLIAAAALVGLMTTGAMVGSAAAQTTAPAAAPAAPAPAAKPMAKPMAKKAMPMKKAAAKKMPMHKAAAKTPMKMKMSKEGHKMDNIADKLNACEMKPTADRQSCISDATKM